MASITALPSSQLFGQSRPLNPHVNYLLSADDPPGAVAAMQGVRGMPSYGSYQAVSITGPQGLQIGLAQDGMFLPNIAAPVTTAMRVGSTYRFRVANIPFRPGAELFPTVEIVDRLHAPAGREHRFPIPVTITRQDLELALRGALVKRVIYLEDSEIATPIQTSRESPLVHDVGAATNALQEADRLGRPVAIIRIGSRVPSAGQTDLTNFLYGCPPWLPMMKAPNRQQLIDSGQWLAGPPVVPAKEIYSETPQEPSPRLPPVQ